MRPYARLPRRRRLRAAALLAALALPCLGAGCGGPSGPVTLTVLATSSLTEVFGEMGTAYHQEHPDTRLRFVFGGSTEMVDRLSDHAPGDVLVAADRASMQDAADYLAGRPASSPTTRSPSRSAPATPGASAA